jgi:hypothetical protein
MHPVVTPQHSATTLLQDLVSYSIQWLFFSKATIGFNPAFTPAFGLPGRA